MVYCVSNHKNGSLSPTGRRLIHKIIISWVLYWLDLILFGNLPSTRHGGNYSCTLQSVIVMDSFEIVQLKMSILENMQLNRLLWLQPTLQRSGVVCIHIWGVAVRLSCSPSGSRTPDIEILPTETPTQSHQIWNTTHGLISGFIKRMS